MKKYIIVTLLLSMAFSARAQEVPAVKPEEKTQQEVFEMLDLLGVMGYRFDLSAFTAGDYMFSPFIDEYVAGQKVEDNRMMFGGAPNWREMFPIEDPEEREKFLEGKKLSADGQKFLSFEDLGLFISSYNDSTTLATFNFYGGMRMSVPLKLITPENSQRGPMYNCRPFKIAPFTPGETRIPLLFYSSFWWDEQYNVFRSCMEKEIEPDLSNDALKNIPHYYVIGITAREIQ